MVYVPPIDRSRGHWYTPAFSVGEDGRSRDADPEIATYKTRGVRCGANYPLVMTNIAIENGDL